jgi:hypothetical protein
LRQAINSLTDQRVAVGRAFRNDLACDIATGPRTVAKNARNAKTLFLCMGSSRIPDAKLLS